MHRNYAPFRIYLSIFLNIFFALFEGCRLQRFWLQFKFSRPRVGLMNPGSFGAKSPIKVKVKVYQILFWITTKDILDCREALPMVEGAVSCRDLSVWIQISLV